MIALVPLLLEAAPVLTDIGRQALPAKGCAAYLWQIGPTPQFVAMVEAGVLRVGIDGKTVALVRTGVRGEARLGLPASGDFAGDGIAVTLDMAIVPESDLADGARVPQATLSVARNGDDLIVVPAAGLVGCATRPR